MTTATDDDGISRAHTPDERTVHDHNERVSRPLHAAAAARARAREWWGSPPPPPTRRLRFGGSGGGAGTRWHGSVRPPTRPLITDHSPPHNDRHHVRVRVPLNLAIVRTSTHKAQALPPSRERGGGGREVTTGREGEEMTIAHRPLRVGIRGPFREARID